MCRLCFFSCYRLYACNPLVKGFGGIFFASWEKPGMFMPDEKSSSGIEKGKNHMRIHLFCKHPLLLFCKILIIAKLIRLMADIIIKVAYEI